MTTRILAPEEWPTSLKQTELLPLLPYISPENAAIVVVEDEGRTLGSLAVLRATHLEGMWISPEHRGNAGITRALIRHATTLARVHGEEWVIGGAADDRMRGILGRLGGVPMPMDFYALWIGRQECRQQ